MAGGTFAGWLLEGKRGITQISASFGQGGSWEIAVK
jgi:hypothetical protein